MRFESFWSINYDWTHLDTIFNRLTFPFVAPRGFFLPGQPAKFLLVPSSFWAFLASSSLLAEDLTWHVACLLCPHRTHEFPAFEHLLLPMPAIPLNSWGLRFWMAWVQMAFRSCCHYNRHLFQHTLRHWKASRLKCLDAGRVDENWWNMNPYQASKRHGRFDEEIQTVRYWELSFVNQTDRESQECLKPQSNCIQVTPAPSQADVILCSFQHQAWCWDLGIGGASWVSCMTSSTSWPSWFQQQCCFPTEAVWGDEHIEQKGVYHCHIAVSSLCCDLYSFWMSFFFQMCFTLFLQKPEHWKKKPPIFRKAFCARWVSSGGFTALVWQTDSNVMKQTRHFNLLDWCASSDWELEIHMESEVPKNLGGLKLCYMIFFCDLARELVGMKNWQYIYISHVNSKLTRCLQILNHHADERWAFEGSKRQADLYGSKFRSLAKPKMTSCDDGHWPVILLILETEGMLIVVKLWYSDNYCLWF